MLKTLYIRNYALIDELQLEFDAGLSVITGETGAGKSIILGALGLILGHRANLESLREPNKKCIIEGRFGISGYGLENFFLQNDLDYGDECLIRREISGNGKSRAFINDTPAPLTLLKDLGEQLVDIHSQNRTMALDAKDVQLSILDQYAGNDKYLKEFRSSYRRFIEAVKELKELKEAEASFHKEQDYQQYLFDELEKLAPRAGETEEIKGELDRIRNSALIKEALFTSIEVLSQGEESVIDRVNNLIHLLEAAGKHFSGAADLGSRLKSASIEIKDITEEAVSMSEEDDADPEKMGHLTDRLDELLRLQNKHNVQDDKALIDIMQQLQSSLDEGSGRSAIIVKKEEELSVIQSGLKEQAKILRKHRTEAKPILESDMSKLLAKLGMKEASFNVSIENTDDIEAFGTEKVSFLFNANKGGRMMALSQVASGGERSRLMLAIKSCITQRSILPTLILDEIDSGVSGEVANRVGDIMEEMGRRLQLIAITHLPQIAAKGKRHYLVFKETDNTSTFTRVKALNREERIKEIAGLLSGEAVTQAAQLTAQELLGQKN